MRGLWWTLKLCAGLVLIGCLLAIILGLVFPQPSQRLGAWLGVLLLSASVYWIANVMLAGHVRPPAASPWQGQRFVLPVPLLRQGLLCLVLASLGLGIPFAFVRRGDLLGWQTGLVMGGGLLGLWLCRAAILGLLNMRRAGYALKLDADGIHFPGLPLLPWTHVTGLALEPPRPDSDRPKSLVLQMRSVPDRPSGLHGLWRAALPGASITRNSVRLPLPMLRKPAVLLDAAKGLWHRYGLPPVPQAQQSGGTPARMC